MRSLGKTGLLLLAALFALPAVTLAQAENSAVVVTFGDSITKGWPYQPHDLNGARGGPYPSELERLLRDNNPGANIQVLNYGSGGENTFHSVSRLESVLATSRPQWVAILIGTNDLWTGISANSTAANIGFMIDRVRAWGATPVVSNLLPSTYAGHPGHLIPTWYNPAIKFVVESRGAAFNDIYGVFNPHWVTTSRDGLHPNFAGYLVLGQTFCAQIEICSGRRLRSYGSSATSDVRPAAWLDVLLGD